MEEQTTEGATLGKYRILGTLGRGSMGVVYKAEDPAIGRVVAIKTLRKIGPSKFQDAESALERFRTEARSAGKLRHPNIITIFDASINDDTPFIVMDYVEGKSLESLIHAAGRIEPKRAIPMLRQLAEALDEAHKHGVIHRDIKPSNVVVDSQDRPYILDFGVAKLNETIQEEMADQPKEPVMGTPAYMAPEQILNRRLTAQSDIFSFALVCYEVLSGSRPFPGDTFNEVVNSILHNSPIPITSIVPDFPLQLEVEFEHALAKRPEDRPQTALEVVRVLAKALETSTGVGTANLAAGSTTVARPRKASEWKSIGASNPEAQQASADIAASGVASQATQMSGSTQGPNRPSEPQAARPSSARPAAGGGSGALVPFGEVGARGQADPAFSEPGAAPGDVFSHDDVALGQRVRFRREFSPMRAFIFAATVVALVGSSYVTYSILQGKSPFAFLSSKPTENSPATTTPDGPTRQQIIDQQSEPGIVIDDIPDTLDQDIVVSALSELTNKQLLIVVLSEQTDLKRRLEALTEIRARQLPELMQVAGKLLSHESYVVRIEAAKSLGEFGNREAAPMLLDHLSDYDPLVREEIAHALGKLGSLRSVAYLKRFLAGEENPKVQKALRDAVENITGLPLESS